MNYTILIVDDEWQNLESIQKYFEFKGYGTFIAENGDKALEILKNEKIDYIVLNIDMLGMTGDEVIEAIKTDPEFKGKENIPIAICTALLDSNKILEGKASHLIDDVKSGEIPIFTKPVVISELFMKIEDTLHAETEGEKENISPNCTGMKKEEKDEYKRLE